MEKNDFFYTIWRKQRELTLKDVSNHIHISVANLCRFERKKLKNPKAYEAIKKKYDSYIQEYEMGKIHAK